MFDGSYEMNIYNMITDLQKNDYSYLYFRSLYGLFYCEKRSDYIWMTWYYCAWNNWQDVNKIELQTHEWTLEMEEMKYLLFYLNWSLN